MRCPTASTMHGIKVRALFSLFVLGRGRKRSITSSKAGGKKRKKSSALFFLPTRLSTSKKNCDVTHVRRDEPSRAKPREPGAGVGEKREKGGQGNESKEGQKERGGEQRKRRKSRESVPTHPFFLSFILFLIFSPLKEKKEKDKNDLLNQKSITRFLFTTYRVIYPLLNPFNFTFPSYSTLLLRRTIIKLRLC